jgi:hypothetical protein
MNNQSKNTECCPKFNPAPWDGKTFEWKGKKFIKDSVFTLFYMPINFGGVITKMMKKVEASGAKCQDNLCLSDHTSKWNMDLYVAVDKKVAHAENVNLSGKYFSKVYEGPFKNTGKWVRDFGADATKNGLALQKMFMWYTTCPKCAKKYGKNYVVIVGQIG